MTSARPHRPCSPKQWLQSVKTALQPFSCLALSVEVGQSLRNVGRPQHKSIIIIYLFVTRVFRQIRGVAISRRETNDYTDFANGVLGETVPSVGWFAFFEARIRSCFLDSRSLVLSSVCSRPHTSCDCQPRDIGQWSCQTRAGLSSLGLIHLRTSK